MDIKTCLPTLSTILVIIGAINWGLVGVFHFNLVEALLGSVPILVKIVYSLVGLSGLYLLITFKNHLNKNLILRNGVKPPFFILIFF